MIKNLTKLYAAYKSGCIDHNILNTYFSFIANMMIEERIDTIDTAQISKLFSTRYGYGLPSDFIRQVLGIGLANGSIVDDRGQYKIRKDIISKYKFDTSDFEEKWSELQTEFIKHCNQNNININLETLEAQLLELINETDEAILCNDFATDNQGVSEIEFGWHSFAKMISAEKPAIFDFVAAICTSNISQQAIFYSSEYGSDYSKLSVFLDSPMVFALLGMDSLERKESYEMLLDRMQNAGCSIHVFDHNFREIEGIISRAASWALSTDYDIRKANNAAKFFHDSAMNETKIIEYCGEIESRLNSLRITLKQATYVTDQDRFQEDETTLYDMILQKYGEQNFSVSEEKRASIRVDVRSVSMIYRERNGVLATQINQAVSIMLTTNNAIANVCKKFESNQALSSGHIPACISADLFGAILWLSSPLGMITYQKKKLLADSYDFLQPTKAMVCRYVESLETARNAGEIDEKKFLFMRTHPIVLDALMNVTHGDYARFSDRTYLEVYDIIVAQSEKKFHDEYTLHLQTKEELNDVRNAVSDLAKKLEQVQLDGKEAQDALSGQNEQLQGELTQLKNRTLNRKLNFYGWLFTVAIVGIPYVVLIAVLELLKGQFSEISLYAVIQVGILLVAGVLALVLFNRGKLWCFNIVRRRLERNQ